MGKHRASRGYLAWGAAAEFIGRQRNTGKDKRFWARLGITPREIAGRWVIAFADLERLTKPNTGPS